MKTVEERAKELASDTIELCCVSELDCDELIELMELLVKALKTQDKITRHACAENVLNIDSVEIEESSDNNYLDCDNVHSVIINTKSV